MAEDTQGWRRAGRRIVLLGVLPALAVLAGLGWWAISGRYITTENAYVKASIVAISADIDGRVVAVDVSDDQEVAPGDILFRLDPDVLEVDKDRAAARMVSVKHQIEGWRAAYQEVQAEIEEAEERALYYHQQADRQRALERQGIASAVRLEEAELELAAAGKRVAALEQRRRAVLARLGGDPDIAVDLHPAYREAVADREKAILLLNKTVVRAPISGVISRMKLEPGEWVEEGEPVFTIVEQERSWIEANLKETQLTHIKVGQRVAIGIDSYPDHSWSGRVASISAATGAEFALIPPQNASGNWVKVVQRLPVRIELDPVDGLPPLRAGMTASVAIDTERDTSLAKLVNEAVASVLGGT
ncbi:MAG: HlyD family secretion protein [Alphaproteobacteria bacterium]|nr:HlyD family secretion protein [Alphaproteobacteria bacterium]